MSDKFNKDINKMYKTIIMPEIIKNSRFSSCVNVNCPFLRFTVETPYGMREIIAEAPAFSYIVERG